MKLLKDKRKKCLFIVILIFLISITFACIYYLNDSYKADSKRIEKFISGNNITMEIDKEATIFKVEGATKGFIFYPGGKVDYESYIPLMNELASRGIFCVLLEMPFNLAVFDINAADGIQEKYPQIESWYIGGYSLGGAMSATYISDYKDKYEGLILLGAYSTENLSDSNFEVLSIYGSEDKVMNYEKYNSNKANLPEDFTEKIIEGGCHSYFGMYGNQKGDGNPSITNEEQICIAANLIAEQINY